MNTEDIRDTLVALRVGDRVVFNDRRAKFTVCGISPHFVLAHYGQTYTIFSKEPFTGVVMHNNIHTGDFFCGPDWWVFGYALGYHFTDREWVSTYLSDLESGDTEISMRKRAPVYFLSVVGHTDKVYASKNPPASIVRRD